MRLYFSELFLLAPLLDLDTAFIVAAIKLRVGVD